MWIKCPNGLDTLVHHEDHIKRLLNEGGVEIPDPTLPSLEVVPEQTTQEEKQPVEIPVNELVITDDGPVVRKRGRQAKQ